MKEQHLGSGGDYERIERAIRYIQDNSPAQPGLEEVAAAVGLSPFHFQRLFRRWAGISPKRFLQFLTVEHAKRLLDESASVLDAALEVGLSGPGRLHDHFVSLEAVTPGEYKSEGSGLRIRYGVHGSPFGRMLLASTERGVCGLSFLDGGSSDENLRSLRDAWPGAELAHEPEATAPLAARLFHSDGGALPVLVRGTNFQIAVWKALLAIPAGRLRTYAQVAWAVGRPSASRAVGGAVAANPVAYLVPCHRVIRAVGEPGGYRWGAVRKRALIAWEAARRQEAGTVSV